MKKNLLNLFNIKKNSNKKFYHPLHEDALNKEDLLEAVKVLISRQLTMSKKQLNLKIILKKN